MIMPMAPGAVHPLRDHEQHDHRQHARVGEAAQRLRFGRQAQGQDGQQGAGEHGPGGESVPDEQRQQDDDQAQGQPGVDAHDRRYPTLCAASRCWRKRPRGSDAPEEGCGPGRVDLTHAWTARSRRRIVSSALPSAGSMIQEGPSRRRRSRTALWRACSPRPRPRHPQRARHRLDGRQGARPGQSPSRRRRRAASRRTTDSPERDHGARHVPPGTG